ncbi:MAG TPA: hypothetical protein VFM39_05750 [bacterium]|nr:hypothetical protein [bacterium]
MQSVLAPAAATPERSTGSLRVAGALCILLGVFVMTLGTIWDIQWHVVIGRDSFWIPPHVVLYAGLALTIVSVGALVFWETFARAADGISVFGVTAPAGIWIAAAGIATMLLAAPFDNWWHNTFGLDTTLWSPPHMMGLAGGGMIPCGAVAVLGRELRHGLMSSRVARWAWVGMVFGFGEILGVFNLAIQPASRLSVLSVGTDPFLYPLLASLALPPVLAASRAATGNRWGAITTAMANFALALAASGFAALAFRVVLPSLSTPAPGFGAGPSILRLLPLLPALALDLLAGTPGMSRWREAVGAVAWAVVLMAVVVLVSMRFAGTVSIDRALPVLPLVALGASVSSAVGNWLGRLIAAHER